MKIRISDLKTERQWRAAIGMDKSRFEKLLVDFKKSYLELYHDTLSGRLVETGRAYCIGTEEELLLYTLFSLKSGLTYDLLGFVTGMDASNAQRNQKTGVDVLTKTLADKGHLPRRNFLDVKDFEDYFSGGEELIVDATEQAIQRPSGQEEQKTYYSGKKKTYPEIDGHFQQE
jgi:hypothetical protein